MAVREPVDLSLWCGIGGSYYESFFEKQVASFIEKCAQVGIKKLMPSFYVSPLKSHLWVIRQRAVEGPFEPYEYGERSPLKFMVQCAHDRGLEVHPYIAASVGGYWLRKPLPGALPELQDIAYISRFARAHPEYWTKTQTGRSWLDIDRRDSTTGYPGIGLVSLSYPEVRNYERSLCREFVEDYGVDGVQLECIIPPTDEQGFYLLGYDEPAMRAFREKQGVDPRDLDNGDEGWTRFRAGYVTQYVRELRAELSSLGKVELSVATEATGGMFSKPESAYKQMVDWPRWVEEGLIDVLYAKFWLTPLAWWPRESGIVSEEIARVRERIGGRCKLVAGLVCVGGGQDIGERMKQQAQAAVEAGADGVAVNRADAVEAFGLWDAIAGIGSREFTMHPNLAA